MTPWDFLRNRSLRWKIMISISTVVVVLTACLAFTIVMNHYSQNIISDSYKSNAELTEFSTALSDMENAMEIYSTYRTFESIDAYFNATVRVNDFRDKMQQHPSTDIVRQKEYIVYKLAGSLIQFSGKAVAERRANAENDEDYATSLEIYRTLISEIASLNILLMQNNANIYMENRESLNFITTSTVLFYIAYFSFVLVFLYLLVSQITQPLADISAVAQRVADRDFNVPLFNRTTRDEIGNICRAFDRMIKSIREYIDTIWEKARTENELRAKEIEMQALYADAQLRAFQSQINPHFLFNTLNTGAQLAMMEGADRTCSFIEQTSDFFRYNLRQQKMTATISEELGMIDNYVYIMKVRFGQRLQFEKNIPDKTFSQILPVMTLQPLVENCIKHGLLNTEENGKVVLTVGENPAYILISVSDNGSGMADNTREEILNSRFTDTMSVQKPENGEKNNGIGLINVYSRLRLYFQRDDVFDIMKNESGNGTKFLVRIPKNV